MRLPPAARRPLRLLALLVVAASGATVGWALAPPGSTHVGPLEVQVEVVPSLRPGVHLQLPPVGEVDFDTHAAPVAVNATVRSVDLDSAVALIGSPQGLLTLQVTAPQLLREVVLRAALSAAVCALLGAVLAAALVYRRPLRVIQSALAALSATLLLASGVALSVDPAGLQQPRFSGLLSRAPYLAGAGTGALERLESYRSGLADLVRSVSALYTAADRVPVMAGEQGSITVLHVSDIHLNPLGFDVAERLVEQFAVDVVVDTGDVTTWGTDMESSLLSRIPGLGVPYVFVRGNHDSPATQAAVAAQPNAVVLDGAVAEVAGLTFAGIGDPQFTPQEGEGAGADERRRVVGDAVERLAEVVQEHHDTHRGDPVDVALVHDPANLDAVLGEVPLVLAGHLHHRVVREDDSGTRVMVQGSTGGAGITAAGLERIEQGQPLALSATLLHFGAEEEGSRMVAFDQVTVGGLGLTSVTVERTVVPVGDTGPDGAAESRVTAPPQGAEGYRESRGGGPVR